MSSIKLYNTLIKIPGVDANEAQVVVDDVASKNEVATKADIKDMATKADLEKVETKIERTARVTIMWICSFMVGYSLVLITLAQLFIDK